MKSETLSVIISASDNEERKNHIKSTVIVPLPRTPSPFLTLKFQGFIIVAHYLLDVYHKIHFKTTLATYDV